MHFAALKETRDRKISHNLGIFHRTPYRHLLTILLNKIRTAHIFPGLQVLNEKDYSKSPVFPKELWRKIATFFEGFQQTTVRFAHFYTKRISWMLKKRIILLIQATRYEGLNCKFLIRRRSINTYFVAKRLHVCTRLLQVFSSKIKDVNAQMEL